jgi:hypothetical protein
MRSLAEWIASMIRDELLRPAGTKGSSGSVFLPGGIAQGCYRFCIRRQTLHRSTKNQSLFVKSECLGREVCTRPCGTYNYDDLGLLVAIDVGEHDFFNRPVAGTDNARSEKSCFIPGWCGIIKPDAETADGASLEVTFCDHGCLTRRKLDLRDKALWIRGIQRAGRKQRYGECKESVHVYSARITTTYRDRLHFGHRNRVIVIAILKATSSVFLEVQQFRSPGIGN